MNMKNKKLFILLLINILLITLCSCGSKQDTYIDSIDEINGQDMGCMSGSIFDKVIEEYFPDSNIIYFSSRSELLLGLDSNKIVGFISDEPVAMMMVARNEDVSYLDEAIGSVEYGICFAEKASDKLEQFNTFLAEKKESGYLEQLQNKWINKEGASQKKVVHELTGENGTLTCVTTPDAAPFSFYSDSTFEGYEIELLNDFCFEYGYGLQIETVSFDALLTSIALNKYDIACNGIYITEERKKSVNFCDPTYSARNVVMIKSSSSVDNRSFIEKIQDSFYKNFIEEDRYLILVRGCLTTLLISVMSIIFGSLLGFIIYLISLRYKKFKDIADFIQRTLIRLPAAIILMILYYVIFNNSSISASIVAIIGFSMMFSFTSYGLLKVGVNTVDRGQGEAALALGYNNWYSFIRVILPQALKVVLDNYLNEIVSLLKNTSIVGYISISDITRASDIIRGRTYDALLPLFTVAIVYYILATLIIKVLRIPFENYINSKVKDHD